MTPTERIAAATGPQAVRLVLAERVEVFGLPAEIDWPKGTAVEADAGDAAEGRVKYLFPVRGPGGVRVSLPARLLRRA